MLGKAGNNMQYIGFDIQETHYGIASDNIIEILRDGVITPLPCAPQGVCGMTHYQGRSYPVLDLYDILKVPIDTSFSCMIMVETKQHYYFVNVHTIPYLFEDGEAMEVPKALADSDIANKQIFKWHDRMQLIISTEKLFEFLLERFRHTAYPW